jgi:hypothetical protein
VLCSSDCRKKVQEQSKLDKQAMASFLRFANRNGVSAMRLAPIMAAAAVTSFAVSTMHYQSYSSCEAVTAENKKSTPELLLKPTEKKKEALATTTNSSSSSNHAIAKNAKIAGFQPEAKGYFYDSIPNSQLFQPKMAWPMWDDDWDGREPVSSGNDKLDRRKRRYLRKHGVTRHIILVRHGQYDETHRVSNNKDLGSE